jgi:hypothetical protein
MDWLRK